MKKLIFFFLIFISASGKGQSRVQLAPPLLKYQSVFFKNAALVELKFAQQGTQIYYTLNNQPPTVKDIIYSAPVQIKSSFTTIRAFVAGEGFLPSEIVSATFIKDGLKIKSVQQTAANARYRGNGPNTLVDNQGGLTNLNANTWLGYQLDSVEINVAMEGRQKITSILINCLQDQGSWVFLPVQVQVFYFDENKKSFRLIAERLNSIDENEPGGASCKPLLIPLSQKVSTEKIKIILKGIKQLPDWHPGKGQPGWLFIDEIKVY